MSVVISNDKRVYEVEYKGKSYSATIISHANGSYTESFVLDSNGNDVEEGIAMEILSYVHDNGGGFLHEQL